MPRLVLSRARVETGRRSMSEFARPLAASSQIFRTASRPQARPDAGCACSRREHMRAPTAHGTAHLFHAASCQHDLRKTSGRREAGVASYGMPSQAAASSMVRPKRRGECRACCRRFDAPAASSPCARGASASRRRPTASRLAHHHHQARHRGVLTAALGPNHLLQPLMLARCDARLPAAGHRLASTP